MDNQRPTKQMQFQALATALGRFDDVDIKASSARAVKAWPMAVAFGPAPNSSKRRGVWAIRWLTGVIRKDKHRMRLVIYIIDFSCLIIPASLLKIFKISYY